MAWPAASRAPFDAATAELLEEFRPRVVSFHFGLPAPRCWRACATGARASCRRPPRWPRALWLQAQGVDAVIAQGLEAGGHRGMFLTDDLSTQTRHVCAGAAAGAAAAGAGDRRRRHRRCPGRGSGHGAGRQRRAGRHGLPAVPEAAPVRCTGQPCSRAEAGHGSDQCVHRASGARHRQPRGAGTRADRARMAPAFPLASGGMAAPARTAPRRLAARTSRRCGRVRTPAAAVPCRRRS
jgi:nitronate monooxygenase